MFTLMMLALAAPPKTAATVNGEPIIMAEVERLAGPNAPRSLSREVLESLIEDKLFEQYVTRTAPAADAKAIDAQLTIIRERFESTRKGMAFDAHLKTLGLTPTAFRQSLELQWRFQKLLDSKTTPAQLRAYHDAHREHYDGSTVTMTVIGLAVHDRGIEGEWAAAERKLTELRSQLVKQTLTLSEGVKAHNQLPGAGAVGAVARRDLRFEDAVLAAAFALKPGEVSAPVRTSQAVQLIAVTARTHGTPRDFDKIRDLVQDDYAADAKRNLITQLRTKAEIRIELP